MARKKNREGFPVPGRDLRREIEMRCRDVHRNGGGKEEKCYEFSIYRARC